MTDSNQTQILDSIKESLYDYQKEALQTTLDKNKGQIILPTAMGKTRIASAVLGYDILSKNKEFGIYQVNLPRIYLSYQIMREIFSRLIEYNIDAKFCFVHSGRAIDNEAINNIRDEYNNNNNGNIRYRDIPSIQEHAKLAELMCNTQEQNIPLIIISVYDSAYKVESARRKAFINRPLDVIINDEAHHLVDKRKFKLVYGERATLTNKQYFFTATPKTTIAAKRKKNEVTEVYARGMNNSEVYGDILYQKTPREAIDTGMLIRPRKVVVLTPEITNEKEYRHSIGKIIKTSFTNQIDLFNDKHPNIAPKMLVATKGKNEMIRIMRSQYYHEMIEMGIDIFAVHSDKDILSNINGRTVTRQEFLRRLLEVGNDPSKKMIVLHYNILTEGYDVPGLTSLLLLRPMHKDKFLQSYGRIGRPSVNDRIKIDSGELSPTSSDFISKIEKPYGYIILPYFTQENLYDKAQYDEFIENLRSYNYDPNNDVISNYRGDSLPPPGGGGGKVDTRETLQYRTILQQMEDENIAKLLKDVKTNEEFFNILENQNQ